MIKATLHHVDYNCDGVVRPSNAVGLRCSKCRMTAASGPMTVIAGPASGHKLIRTSPPSRKRVRRGGR